MAGTKEGAAKRRQTMIDRYYGGDEQAYLAAQRQQAARGGANANPDNPANFKNNKKLASKAGKKGGKLSKRGKPTILGIEPDLNTVGGTE
jgi:general stress protein YciG